MKSGHFTPAAQRLWDAIPVEAKHSILDNVWCAHCRTSRRMRDYTGAVERGDIHLQGLCVECGHVVARIVETSEMPPVTNGNGS